MSRPLRALILAAGLGTRLRPLTLKSPKCLVKVAGKPLLELWLKELEKLDCEAALINTHHLAEQVQAFLEEWKGTRMNVQTTYEPILLGTAATLLLNQNFFKAHTGLLIHADNVTRANLKEFLEAHKNRSSTCLITMLTFRSSKPSQCGIVEIDNKGVVQGFHEKVAEPPGNCANGAVYLFDPPFLEWLQMNAPNAKDFSTEVLPLLLGRIQTWHTNEIFQDIGTPESLLEIQKLMGSSNGVKQ